MRNLFFTIAVLFFAGNLVAQKGLELTVGFTPGTSWMLNDEDFAEGDVLDFQATFGFQTGLTVGYNFNEKLGVSTGIGYASLSQNYITGISGVPKSDQIRTTVDRGYIRVPLLFRAGGDNTSGSCAFFRFGPHFDFLTTATSTNKGSANNPITTNNMLNFRDADEFASVINAYDLDETPKFYSNFVLGLTLDVGGRIRINNQMGILLLFHLESSLLNPEGEDAKYYLIHTGTRGSKGTAADTSERSVSWSIMAGLNIGFQYTIDFSK